MGGLQAHVCLLSTVLFCLRPCKANIESLQLVCSGATLPNCPAGFIPVPGTDGFNGDLNQGAGGNYIRLCQKPATSGGLTEVTILANARPIQGACNGASKWVSATGCNGDLNAGVNKPYALEIFLCEQSVPSVGPPIELQIIAGDDPNIQCPEWYQKVGVLSGNGDANQGAGGKFIYLCYTDTCTFEKPVGTWSPHSYLPPGASAQETVGTETSQGTSYTETEGKLASTTISAGFEYESPAGAKASVSIDNTNEVSSEVAKETLTSDVLTKNVERKVIFGDMPQLWQWVFTLPEQKCPQRNGLPGALAINTATFIFSPSAGQIPCCLPGYNENGQWDVCLDEKYLLVADPKNPGPCKVSKPSLRQVRRSGLRSNLRRSRRLSMDVHDETGMLQFSIEGDDFGDANYSSEEL